MIETDIELLKGIANKLRIHFDQRHDRRRQRSPDLLLLNGPI